MSKLTVDEKMAIFNRVGEEIQDETELRQLFEKQDSYRVYDGFEPSGRIHIAQGILRAININRMIRCGCHCIFYVADWYAFLNNKCGGNMDHIQKLGKYFIKVWEHSGMNMKHVEFIWASELIKNSSTYWLRVLDIARINSLARIQKCSTIMGRTESDAQPISQIMYPCMQCSDIFELKADICQLGLDQRKVNMLAREYAEKKGITKPVVVSHHMLLGLVGGKMSKSIQGSSIFMDDTLEDITLKVNGADCELKEEGNPILEYFKYLVFPAIEVSLQGFQGPIEANQVEYKSYEEIRDAFLAQKVTAEQLKEILIKVIDTLLTPVRNAFSKDPEMQELQQFAITTRLTR